MANNAFTSRGPDRDYARPNESRRPSAPTVPGLGSRQPERSRSPARYESYRPSASYRERDLPRRDAHREPMSPVQKKAPTVPAMVATSSSSASTTGTAAARQKFKIFTEQQAAHILSCSAIEANMDREKRSFAQRRSDYDRSKSRVQLIPAVQDTFKAHETRYQVNYNKLKKELEASKVEFARKAEEFFDSLHQPVLCEVEQLRNKLEKVESKEQAPVVPDSALMDRVNKLEQQLKAQLDKQVSQDAQAQTLTKFEQQMAALQIVQQTNKSELSTLQQSNDEFRAAEEARKVVMAKVQRDNKVLNEININLTRRVEELRTHIDEVRSRPPAQPQPNVADKQADGQPNLVRTINEVRKQLGDLESRLGDIPKILKTLRQAADKAKHPAVNSDSDSVTSTIQQLSNVVLLQWPEWKKTVDETLQSLGQHKLDKTEVTEMNQFVERSLDSTTNVVAGMIDEVKAENKVQDDRLDKLESQPGQALSATAAATATAPVAHVTPAPGPASVAASSLAAADLSNMNARIEGIKHIVEVLNEQFNNLTTAEMAQAILGHLEKFYANPRQLLAQIGAFDKRLKVLEECLQRAGLNGISRDPNVAQYNTFAGARHNEVQAHVNAGIRNTNQ